MGLSGFQHYQGVDGFEPFFYTATDRVFRNPPKVSTIQVSRTQADIGSIASICQSHHKGMFQNQTESLRGRGALLPHNTALTNNIRLSSIHHVIVVLAFSRSCHP